MFQLPSDLLLHVGALAQRNFPAGSFVEVFQIEPSAGGGFVREDLPVFHVSDSMNLQGVIELGVDPLNDGGMRRPSVEMEIDNRLEGFGFVLKPRALWISANRC